ncbi:T9SS C-terminal target domain-containing protein [Spirosoma arcticum]
MKKFRLTIAVLLSVWSLAGTQGAKADNGSGANGVKIEKSESKKVRLYIPTGSLTSNAAVDVAIIDAEGNVLYQGVAAKNKAGQQSFNLKNLPDGQYYITAGNNAWWMSQGVTIRGNALTVDARNLQQVMQPTLTAYEKNKIEVALPATNVTNASVAIYDAQNVLVHTEKFTGPARRFDLSSLPEGAYTFVVGPEQKHFSSRVDVRK